MLSAARCLQLFKALDGANLQVSAANADHPLPLFVPRNGTADLPQQLQVPAPFSLLQGTTWPVIIS